MSIIIVRSAHKLFVDVGHKRVSLMMKSPRDNLTKNGVYIICLEAPSIKL